MHVLRSKYTIVFQRGCRHRLMVLSATGVEPPPAIRLSEIDSIGVYLAVRLLRGVRGVDAVYENDLMTSVKMSKVLPNQTASIHRIDKTKYRRYIIHAYILVT